MRAPHIDLITASGRLQHLDIAPARANDLPDLFRVDVEAPDAGGIGGEGPGWGGVTCLHLLQNVLPPHLGLC